MERRKREADIEIGRINAEKGRGVGDDPEEEIEELDGVGKVALNEGTVVPEDDETFKNI